MKQLTNLNDKLKTLVKGLEIKLDAETEGTVKTIMIDALCVARDVTPTESARAWALAQALLKTNENSVDVEDQDALIVKKCVTQGKHMVQVREPVLASITEVPPKEAPKQDVAAPTNPA